MGRNLCSWFFLLMPDRLSRLKPSACSPFRPPTWMLGSHICWHHSCLARCVGRRMLASWLPCQVCRQGYVGILAPLPGASAGVYWHHGCLARCVSMLETGLEAEEAGFDPTFQHGKFVTHGSLTRCHNPAPWQFLSIPWIGSSSYTLV